MIGESGATTVAYRDQDEVDEAVSSWTDEDYLRLTARAVAASQGTDMSPEDVLGEAVELLLRGRRPWKIGVPLEAHMTMVMKQVGFNRRRALRSRPTRELEVLDKSQEVYRGQTVEDAVGSALRVESIERALGAAFADDLVGWAIFEARLVEQMSVEETCAFAGIPREQYETVLKRVNRKLAKMVEAGAIR